MCRAAIVAVGIASLVLRGEGRKVGVVEGPRTAATWDMIAFEVGADGVSVDAVPVGELANGLPGHVDDDEFVDVSGIQASGS